ncbi:hypothetical protein ACFXPQ_07665 [Streptomyces lydicus]|uniref:hypothetical protein n=1 Tax=Streptomyces lydicus TaxID=47763 RepID=UPI0036810AEB
MSDTSTSSARRSPLLVPLFALLGLGGLAAYGKADDAHVAAEWAHCGDLPLTWQMYLSAYGRWPAGYAPAEATAGELRFCVHRLCETLRDALRIAESRGGHGRVT